MHRQVKEIPGEEVPETPQPVFFLRIRTIAFSCIIFLSFLWIVLFCIIIFAQWDLLDHVERSLILIMLFIDTITVVMIPILLLQPFRPWLDGARVLFLLLAHGGIAALFAGKSSEFVCYPPGPDTPSNQEDVCRMIILYVNIFGWIIPTLSIIYGVGLGVLMRRLSQLQVQAAIAQDVEKQNRRATNSLQSQHTSLQSSREAQLYAYAI